MMSKKEEHIDYSDLPDDLVTPAYDPLPEPGDDGKEFERKFKMGCPLPSADMDEIHQMFIEAAEKDSKVLFEMLSELDVIDEFLTRRAAAVRSKPAVDLYRKLQDWVEKRRGDLD